MAARKRKVTIKVNKKHHPVKQSPNNDTNEYIKLYLTLAGAFIFSCFCTLLIWYFFLRVKIPFEHVSIIPVQVETLSSTGQPFVDDVVHREKPLIIRNSFIKEWPALRKWSPEYLSSKEKTIKGIYSNDNKWFGPYYDRSKPLNDYTSRINDYSTDLTLPTHEFTSLLSNPDPNQYIYYTASIDQFGEWALDDIMPYADLLTPNPSHSSINVWIGQPGVTAHCHYDGYHNFYAQLYGTKRFVLFSPTSYTGLYPYPFLHPSHAQAQVNLSDPSHVELYPSVKDLVSYVAVLHPGDLLYVPPLWFHHVEAIDVSMSVNVWTDTQQTVIMDQVFNTPLPILEIRWNGDHLKAIGSSVILYRLVRRVCEVMKCTSQSTMPPDEYLMFKLWDSRYRVLMYNSSVLYSKFGDGIEGKARHRKSLLCENDRLPDLFYEGLKQRIDGYPVNDYLSTVAGLISQLPHNTWETWFSNYVEYIAYNAVPLRYVGVFLRYYDTCVRFF